ncbi:MAG: polysaccharide biosynthesis/export family protein [Desulfovibrionaceae bacterium]|nr:polysaccharide biosynthesis/export family protein [Desulfovibrionaceae bacterium]
MRFLFLVFLLCMTTTVYAASTAQRQAMLGALGHGVLEQQEQQNTVRAQQTVPPDGVYPVKDRARPMTRDDIMMQTRAQRGAGRLSALPGERKLSVPLEAPPAWAQRGGGHERIERLLPYGSDLFLGNFAGTWQSGANARYEIQPGDRIMVRLWGAVTFDGVVVVDQQGNIFIPEVGPLSVEGVTNGGLQAAVDQQIKEVFTQNVEAYVDLLSTQPVAVFVTGNVVRPGHYAGGAGDSVLYYLDRAGGIVPEAGSYRKITVKRGRATLATVDLYDFLVNGNLPDITLEDGDVIVVGKRGPGIAALGLVRQQARFELKKAGKQLGKNLLTMVQPQPGATHVSVSGTRNKARFNSYMTLEDFEKFAVYDEDIVEFHADRPGSTIMIGCAGAIAGPSRYAVRRGCALKDLLYYIGVDEKTADCKALYIKRRSVALQQKKAIDDSLRNLEKSVLTARSQSVDEAKIRVEEASLVQDFVKRAQLVEPDGVVVVSRQGALKNPVLEDGDIIYIPHRSDVVQIVGEVAIPKAVVYDETMKLKDYVEHAGGFTDRADKSTVLVMKPNGEIGKVATLGISPGDQLMVMPMYDSKAVQAIKDIVQIIYQLAVSAGVVLIPLWT